MSNRSAALAAFAVAALVFASPTLGESSQLASPASRTFGPLGLPTPAVSAPSSAVHAQEVPISDEQLKRLAANDPAAPNATERLRHPVTRPLPARSDVRYGLYSFSNSKWGGYVADLASGGSLATGASGTFVVNHVTTCPTCPSVAPWTGVGGVYQPGPLIQTGVDETTMQAWIEVYPDPPQFYFYVRADDLMFSKVQLNPATGLWLMLIADLTSGVYYGNYYQIAATSGSLGTAEWIFENTDVAPLPSFSQIPFRSASWVDARHHPGNEQPRRGTPVSDTAS